MENAFPCDSSNVCVQKLFVSSKDQSAAFGFCFCFRFSTCFPFLVPWAIPDSYMGCLEHSLFQVVLVEVVELQKKMTCWIHCPGTLAGSVAHSQLEEMLHG